jgi:hypothetical protein
MEQALGKVFKKGKPRSLRKGTEPYELRFKSRIITEYLKGDKSYAMLGRQGKDSQAGKSCKGEASKDQ